MADESVGELAELYLGNLLYALERCAMALEAGSLSTASLPAELSSIGRV